MTDNPSSSSQIGADSFIDSATKLYAPAGRCIYCFQTDIILRPEHIVPYSMGSVWELPGASCEACMRITGKFEQICARDMFGNVRAQWKIYSRKKKDRRERFAKGLPNPLKLPGVETPSAAGPLAPLAMPVFQQPGLLSERSKNSALKVTEVHIVFPTIEGHQGPAKKAKGKLHNYPFARMLAKIAYAAAVAEYGLDSVPKDLVPYILGTDPSISEVVGSCPFPYPPHPPMVVDEKGKLGIESFRVSPGIWRGNGRQLVVTRVQLFRFLDGPTYWVVVGPASEYLIARVEGPSALAL
jgi:hypothetical protein